MSYYECGYEEKEPNYPEVEEIIEKATAEISKFLHNTFVNEYKNIETKEIELNEYAVSLNKKRREIQERETELAKSEQEQYEKLKLKWFKELGLSFDIGDTVYYYKDITKRVTCPTCNGEKKVKAKVESANNTLLECELQCPTCKGYGTILGKKEYEVIEAKVSEIKVAIKKMKSNSIKIEHYDFFDTLATCVWIRNKKDNESKEINGNKLYKTKEECEKAIELLLKGELKQ